jgi:hypothetical protein
MCEKKTMAAPLKMPLTPRGTEQQQQQRMCILRRIRVCGSPMYEKKTIAAPLKMPLTPKGVKGWMLAGLDLTKPACGQKITEITLSQQIF